MKIRPIQPIEYIVEALNKRSVSVLENTFSLEIEQIKTHPKVLLPKIASRKIVKLSLSPLPTLPFPRVIGN